MREKEELVPTSRKNYNGLLREEKEKLKEFQVEIKLCPSFVIDILTVHIFSPFRD